MKLDPSQQAVVAKWVSDGVKLSDIQKRIGAELGVTLTYMEVRFLVDDLKVIPKDPEPVKPAEPPTAKAPQPPTSAGAAGEGAPVVDAELDNPGDPAAAAGVAVSVDAVTRPGAVVSGQVTFSDGKKASWLLDQMGRFGVVPTEKGYKPTPTDMQTFQQILERELAKLGF